ncbi:uncharacterized protein LOC107829157 [Nicotiana tabacum]|uniref:Uncharacterized protein LOC107829157 n=1 Tax=Nicotiana tabacum TaxID=4097 RepID=A0AC58UAM1_TOBAC
MSLTLLIYIFLPIILFNFCVFAYTAVNNMTTQLNFIETLTSSNYKKWKQDVEIVLGLMDLDFAFIEQKPAEPTTTSTTDEKAKYEKWMKANKLSLMIMKRSISDHIKGAIKDNGNAKYFLSAIGQKFLESDKAEIVINCLSEETKLTWEVKKLEVMKEGLYQIRDVLIDKSIGYKETRHQESLVHKKLTKTLGHSSRCVFTLLLYYLYGSIWDIEVEVCGGLYAIGHGDKFRLCMGKILTSTEQNILQSGVKQLSRVLGLFKFVGETAGMKGDLEVQGHLCCVGAENKSFTYRNNLFFLHSISY